ncbi:putative transcription factor C2H2 family [Lupinus albus]|uniref:Putative transcription factor C2H2 family n=1 Tax=Lupinus albus TaxID=3870 RepID=A0A6A4Q343_LUPAL|nr:putative transcription factor C2H2 family [Lupinus albus]
MKMKGNSNNTNTNCCYLCRKKFPTIKSLCGHMRSHPEREWRGIQPPLYLNDDVVVASPSSNHYSFGDVNVNVDVDVDVDVGVGVAAIDLSDSLCWGWSSTAKRGRKSLQSSSSSSSCFRVREVEEQHMLQEGVYELMLLAGALQCDAGGTSEIAKTKNTIDCSVKSSQKSCNSDHGSAIGVDIENINKNSRNKKKKKGTKKMKLDEIGASVNKFDVIETMKRLYKCSICNESFSCYQSLSAHLSNHKKKFVEFESHEHDHHNGNTTNDAIVDQTHASKATSLAEKCPKILSFDLNMPPTMDEEEKGIQSELNIPSTNLVQSPYHYASSFQNSVTNW